MNTKLTALILSSAFVMGTGHIYGVDPQQSEPHQIETRAAIDVGSGATRVKIAEVDVKTHKILTVLYSQEYPISYQVHLAKSHDNTLDAEIKTLGLKSIHHFKDVADHFGAQKIVVVATSAFRTAKNAPEFVHQVEAITGVKVHIIDQELEGILGFNAVAATVPYNLDDIVVWDIGGGSLQLTSAVGEDKLHVYKGPVGSIAFKDYIIQNIQGKDPKKVESPNPMTEAEIKQAITYGEQLAVPVETFMKDKIADKKTHVIAVGSLFQYGIANLVGQNTVWPAQLQDKVLGLNGKTDAELGKGPFTSVAVSNAIYVLGLMHALNINPVIIKEINNTDGALTYAPFWDHQPVRQDMHAPVMPVEEPDMVPMEAVPVECPAL